MALQQTAYYKHRRLKGNDYNDWCLYKYRYLSENATRRNKNIGIMPQLTEDGLIRFKEQF
jgi:hypothetical protein